MEFKRLITQFTYRIEPQPEGGFIARSSDPSVPLLEAPTREELQQKIQATAMAGLAAQFPELKLPLQNQELKLNFHIEHKPDGGFALHSDSGVQPIEGSQEQVESHLAEKLLALAEKSSPALKQALAAKGISGDVKVFVSKKVFTVDAGSQKLKLDFTRNSSPLGSDAAQVPATPDAISSQARAENSDLSGTISNAPIVPERSSNWTLFLFALTVLVTAALVYLFIHHRG